ncbi:hypothetical protein [Campylobacter devanensis]|nr:hypothetical protein [Campylobacter sp. P0135]
MPSAKLAEYKTAIAIDDSRILGLFSFLKCVGSSGICYYSSL